MLAGRFIISNIGLQPALFAHLNLPIELAYSYVERLEVIIPWRSEDVMLEINISNIYALILTRENIDLESVFVQSKKRIIEDAIKSFAASLEGQQKEKEPGSIQRYLIRLLDNIKIRIGCIHVRYEPPLRNYSCGLQITQIVAQTVNKDCEPAFFRR